MRLFLKDSNLKNHTHKKMRKGAIASGFFYPLMRQLLFCAKKDRNVFNDSNVYLLPILSIIICIVMTYIATVGMISLSF